MNIDNLLDMSAGLVAITSEGVKARGRVTELAGEDFFIFSPSEPFATTEGKILQISDGHDSILAKVIAINKAGLKLCIECYASPGKERRQDVRINDKIYYSIKLLGPASQRTQLLSASQERIRAGKLLQESFLKGRYGFPSAEDAPLTREAPFSQAIWEINRKLDLLINMYLSEDFKNLMQTSPRAVNISGSGMRMVSDIQYQDGDLLELGLILPMSPLLHMRITGEVLRLKTITSNGMERYAVAIRFLELDDETREDIIRYLFRRQREVLRKRQTG